MSALATTDELEQHLQQSLGEYRESAVALLDQVSDLARAYIGQTLTRATSTVTLRGTSDTDLRLPERPVVSVSAVTLDGTTVSTSEYRLLGDTLVRSYGWGHRNLPVAVTYVHGWLTDEVPADLKNVILRATGRAFKNPVGVLAEMLPGGYSATFDTQGNIGGPRILTGDEQMVLNRYRRRLAMV